MSESVYLIREQGSGEPRVSRSALIDQNQLLGSKKRAGMIPARLHSAALLRKTYFAALRRLSSSSASW